MSQKKVKLRFVFFFSLYRYQENSAFDQMRIKVNPVPIQVRVQLFDGYRRCRLCNG